VVTASVDTQLVRDDLPPPCPLCGVRAEELHDSVAAGARCCERCHVLAAPAPPREVRRRSPPPQPAAPPPQTGTYAWFVRSVWAALEDRTQHPVFLIGRGQLAAYCPVRCGGTLAIKFVDTKPPEAIITSDRGTVVGCCSMGCPADVIMAALG